MSKICCLLLSIFVDTTIDLMQQLVNLSQLAHCLFYIYRRSKKIGYRFMRKDLYMDIQSTIQDAFICAATFRAEGSNKPIFLYQLGTDQLENLFSTVRTITHSATCDYLESNERLRMAYQIEDVFSRRPELRPDNRLSFKKNIKNTVDHS